METVLSLQLPSPPHIGGDQILSRTKQMFAPNGLLVAAGRDHRSQQFEFAMAVAKCLAEKRSGLCEAATGTGKSIAILAPALIAASLGKRIVIAVATNALIEQLKNDLPYVQKILGTTVPFAVIKGRSHSICPHRTDNTHAHYVAGRWQGRGPMSTSDNALLGGVLRWTKNLDNVDLTLHEATLTPRVRRLVTIDADDCRKARYKKPTNGGCQYAGSTDDKGLEIEPCRCPFMLSRRAAGEAGVVITNFDVLLWNYKSDGGLIGTFDTVFLDESHEWANKVRDFATVEYSLAVFEKLVQLAHDTNAIAQTVSGITNRLSDAAQQLDDALREFVSIPPYHRDKFFEALLDPSGAERFKIVEIVGRVLACCDELIKLATRSGVSEERREDLDKRPTLRRLLEALGGPTGSSNESNFAISLNVGPLDNAIPSISLRVVPVHLGGYMRQTIHFSSARENAILAAGSDPGLIAAAIAKHSSSQDSDANVICVSATLTPDGTWDHPMRQFAMPSDVVTSRVESPFDYPKNAIWYVPKIMPSPSGGREARDDFNRSASREAARLVDTVGGRTLILCSRRDDMEVAREAISNRGFRVMMQDEAPPRELARRFKEDPTSCLIGSRTFGTGFDVPGGALECVICWKLPYPHPGPVDELLKRRLGSSKWMNLIYTPEMLLAYRQWIGRVIRTTNDIGVIAMLDTSKLGSIGKQLKGAMPVGIRLTRDIEEVGMFLSEHRERE